MLLLLLLLLIADTILCLRWRHQARTLLWLLLLLVGGLLLLLRWSGLILSRRQRPIVGPLLLLLLVCKRMRKLKTVEKTYFKSSCVA